MSESNRFEILFSEEAARALASRVGDNPRYFAEKEIERFVDEEEPMMFRLQQVAAEVEPFEPGEGYDSRFPAANTFIRGGALALSLASSYLTVIQLGDMYDYELGVPIPSGDDPDYVEKQRESNDAHMRVSLDGWELVAPYYADLLERWEDEVSPDVLHNVFFRGGFGHVMYLADKARAFGQHEELKELADQAEGDDDFWDRAFEEELTDDES